MPYVIPGVGNANFDGNGNLTGPGAISKTCFKKTVAPCPPSGSGAQGLLGGNEVGGNLTGQGARKCPILITNPSVLAEFVASPPVNTGYHVVQQTVNGYPGPCYLVRD